MRINLNLENKFNLLLALIFLAGIYISGLFLSKILYQQAEQKLTDEGEILMQIMEEIKYYTSVHLLDSYQHNLDQVEFKPSFVPAFAAREIFSNFQEMDKFLHYQYKEATVNPTNLEDSPNEFEQNLINSFIANRNLNISSGYTEQSNGKFYYISRPLTVKDSSCLQCHSSPDVAPPEMVKAYGDQNGFNWELHQLTSAQTIYIPANDVDSSVRQGMFEFMPMFTGIFAVLILSVNRLLKQTVIKPINQLTRAAKYLSENSSSIRQYWQRNYLDQLSSRGDESGKLAQAFFAMAMKILDREQDLNQAVIDGTKELRLKIIERTTIERKLAKQIKRALLQEKITQEIRKSLDTSKILQTAVNSVGQAFKVSRCQIYSYSEERPPLLKVVAEFIDPRYPPTLGTEVSLDEAICLNTAMSQERAVYWSYVYQTPLLSSCVHIYKKLEINSLLTVRTSYQGKINGAISIQQCDRDRQWQREEVELMESVAAQVGIALAQAELLQQEKQRRREIEAAKQEAEIANRSKTEFLANISHELRTPLNAIIGFSQLMNRDPEINPKQQETINIINRSGEHLLEMINEVLEMSKIESGKTELYLSNFDLKAMLSTLEAMLSIKARSKQLQLIIDCAANVPNYICTDESKLRQVLINLIGNGIKFTQAGKIILRVKQLDNQKAPKCILKFEVEDTGAGIAPREINQIFKAFSQSETGRKSQQGTGLGLPISKRFVELMGGELTVVSKVGKGSTFSFSISSTLSQHAQVKFSSVQTVKSLLPNQPKCRILAVDDIWQSRLLVVRLLSQVGFEVKEAKNGKQALELCQKWHPDLIFMDMRMPIMDGYESTRRIRAMGSDCKIIALTASAFASKQEETIEAGCDDYLRKPFKESDLFTKIKEHLAIQYIYQEDSDNVEDDLNKASFLKLTSTSLQIMPESWLQELKQAAGELDEVKLKELIAQIPEENNDISSSLTNLTDNFLFKQIFDLVI